MGIRSWLGGLCRDRTAASPMDGAEYARMLRDAGVPDGAAPPVTNRDSERDVARMMAYFGIDPKTVPLACQGALRDARRACACCTTVERCHDWFARGRRGDAARLFCPNAETFDAIATAVREAKSAR